MAALLDIVVGWYTPPTLCVAFRAGQIARGLAQFKSVGCPTRMNGKCPYERELFSCAGCTLEGTNWVLPRIQVRSDAAN